MASTGTQTPFDVRHVAQTQQADTLAHTDGDFVNCIRAFLFVFCFSSPQTRKRRQIGEGGRRGCVTLPWGGGKKKGEKKGKNTSEALKWQQLLLQFPEREGKGGETGGSDERIF